MRRGAPLSLAVALAALIAACGSGPERAIRNVVLVSLDSLGAVHVGSYGYERDTTPTLDRLAEQGTLFENAYAQQVWTLTSHLTMVTGLYPQAHGASKERPVSPGAVTLAEILRGQGFRTAAFTGIGGYAGPDSGLGRGFELYRVGRSHAPADNVDRLRWLEEQARLRDADPEHRFFLFAHYFDPHSDVHTEVPYQVPDPYQHRYLPNGLDWARRGDTALLARLQEEGDVNERDREVLTALYDGGVRFTDEEGLAPLLRKLEELGFVDDTLLVVTADHGEEIFEHGHCTHQQPYEETSRVPLVMRGPGIPTGVRVSPLVELVDLQPTILSLLGIEAPANVQGHDLSPLLRGEPVEPRVAYVDGIFGGAPPYLTHKQSNLTVEIDGSRWSYVNMVHDRSEDGARVFETRSPGELYRLDEDPGQLENLRAEHPEIAADLEARLLAWYAENEALARRLGAAPSRADQISEQEKQELRALGYAE